MIATTQQNMTTELEQDLGSTGGPPRNWKGIGIALVVILGVMSLVTLSIFLLTPDESHLLRFSHLTMENLENEDFQVHDPCVTWLNENEVSLCTREGHVLIHNLSTNVTTTLLDNSTLDLKSMKFQVSADKRFILMAYNIRHTLHLRKQSSLQCCVLSCRRKILKQAVNMSDGEANRKAMKINENTELLQAVLLQAHL